MQTKIPSPRNKKVLDAAKNRGIDLDGLLDSYGIKFVVKLLKKTQKPKEPLQENENLTNLIIPDFKVLPENQEQAFQRYLNQLEEAGFKLHSYVEDFVDEDSGEVVGIEMNKIYYL